MPIAEQAIAEQLNSSEIEVGAAASESEILCQIHKV